MAFDAYLLLKDINGESKDTAISKDAENTVKSTPIEIKSFSFGAENNINFGSMTGGGGAGKASFKEFEVAKSTDTASTSLFNYLCLGKHIPDGQIILRRSGNDDPESSGTTYMVFNFKMIMVQDMTWSGSDGDDVCEETVIFQYGAIHIKYWKQNSDGKHEATKPEAKWSRVLNKATDAVA